MHTNLTAVALALALSAAAPAALAGKPCPWNDTQQPEKSKICKAGTIQICQDGQWVSTGVKCTAKLGELGRAEAAGGSRLPRTQRSVSRS